MSKLQYDFSVVGVRNVDRAFASIEQRAVRHNMKMARAFGDTTGGGRRAGATGRQMGPTREHFNKMHAARERDIRREQAKTARAQERSIQRLNRLRSKSYQDDLRHIRRQRKEAQRAASAAVRERRRASSAIMGTAGRSAGGALRAVGATATGALAIGGGFAMSNAVGQQMRETALASQLANQAGRPEIKGQLLRESQNVRGLTGEETLAGLTSFTDLTGDLDMARRLMKDVAKFSIATGAEFQDATAMAGNFANMLKDIEDPAKRAEAVVKAMYSSGGASRMGAVETKDIAGMGGAITAIAGRFSGDKVNAIQTANVLAQVAKTASRSPEEAVTAASNFVDMIGTKANVLTDLGLGDALQRDSEGNVTAINDPKKLIADVFEKTGGDLGTMTKLFGQRGQRVMEGFRGSYESEGRAGIYKQFDRLFNASLSSQGVNEAFDSRLQDPDMQIKEVMKEFNAQIGSELIPVLTKLIPELAKLIPHVKTAAELLGKFVTELADNPLMTMGKLIAAKVVMDIAMAHIGSRIKDALVNSVSGSATSGGAVVTGGMGGKTMKGLAVATTVLLGADVGMAIGNAIAPFIWKGFLDGQRAAADKNALDSADDYSLIKQLEQKSTSGSLTEEERSKLVSKRSDIMQRLAVAGVRDDSNETVQGAADILNDLFGLKSKEQLAQEQADTETIGLLKQDLESINKALNGGDVGVRMAIEEQTTAIVTAIKGNASGGPGPSRPKQAT